MARMYPLPSLFRTVAALAFGWGCLHASTAADARVTYFYSEGDDWFAGVGAMPTHQRDSLYMGSVEPFPGVEPDHGSGAYLYDWRGHFVSLRSSMRGISADARWGVSGYAEISSEPRDVWLHDLLLGTRIRVSRSPDGAPSIGANYSPYITADGDRVLFASNSPGVAPPGTRTPAILEWDRNSGSIVVVAEKADLKAVSADGQVLLLRSVMMSDPSFELLDRSTGVRERYCVPHARTCRELGLSPDGRYIAYAHDVTGYPDHRILHDRQTGEDVIVPGYQYWGAERLVFDHDSERVAYKESTGSGAAAEYRLVVRNLKDGSTRELFVHRRLSPENSPLAFGPGGLIAVGLWTTAITSVDQLFFDAFERE